MRGAPLRFGSRPANGFQFAAFPFVENQRLALLWEGHAPLKLFWIEGHSRLQHDHRGLTTELGRFFVASSGVGIDSSADG